MFNYEQLSMPNFIVQCLAVTCCLIVEATRPPFPMPKYKLVLDNDQIQLAFQYIDRDNDGQVTQADLDLLFDHHPEAAPDKQKFRNLLNIKEGNDVTIRKFQKFMNDKTVTYAVYECSYVRPESLTKVCYEDQIVTYVHLVLPKEDIERFYRTFKTRNGVITLDEVKDLFPGDEGEIQEDKAGKLLMELSGGKNVISEADFNSYVRQQDLHDDFRGCKTVENIYDTTCLREKLARYATQELTELDIALIFQILDDDTDNVVGPSDIAQWCDGCDPDEIIKVILMDCDETEIDYGEFRTFVQKSTVKIRIEKKCLRKGNTKRDKMGCFTQELLKIVSEHHKPIWLVLPTSDILFLFEHLDVSCDGRIAIIEDLQRLGYPKLLAEKFQREMNDDNDPTISLKEFMEYVGEPNVVYALAECKMEPRGPSRTRCYTNRLKVYIAFILERQLIYALFDSYDADKDKLLNEDDLDTILKNDGLVELFVKELGMGDPTVNRAEFRWFVKQQEVSEMFSVNRCENNLACLQKTLLSYILNKMTEFDIQQLYRAIDKDRNWNISPEDLKKTVHAGDRSRELSERLIKTMDTSEDGLATYEEFRTFLIRKGRKKKFEENCENTKRNSANIDCYLQEIWNL